MSYYLERRFISVLIRNKVSERDFNLASTILRIAHEEGVPQAFHRMVTSRGDDFCYCASAVFGRHFGYQPFGIGSFVDQSGQRFCAAEIYRKLNFDPDLNSVLVWLNDEGKFDFPDIAERLRDLAYIRMKLDNEINFNLLSNKEQYMYIDLRWGIFTDEIRERRVEEYIA